MEPQPECQLLVCCLSSFKWNPCFEFVHHFLCYSLSTFISIQKQYVALFFFILMEGNISFFSGLMFVGALFGNSFPTPKDILFCISFWKSSISVSELKEKSNFIFPTRTASYPGGSLGALLPSGASPSCGILPSPGVSSAVLQPAVSWPDPVACHIFATLLSGATHFDLFFSNISAGSWPLAFPREF